MENQGKEVDNDIKITILLKKCIHNTEEWLFDNPGQVLIECVQKVQKDQEEIVINLSINSDKENELLRFTTGMTTVNRNIDTSRCNFKLRVQGGDVNIYYTFTSAILDHSIKKMKGDQGQQIIGNMNIEESTIFKLRLFYTLLFFRSLELFSPSEAMKDKADFAFRLIDSEAAVMVVAPRRSSKSLVISTITDTFAKHDFTIVSVVEEHKNDQKDEIKDKEMRNIEKFYNVFFTELKKMQSEVIGSEIQTVFKFTYVRGVLAVRELETFSTNMGKVEDLRGCDSLLGSTQQEIMSHDGSKEKPSKSGSNKTEGSQMEAARGTEGAASITKTKLDLALQKIKPYCYGFRLSRDQKEAIYSPFALNYLLDLENSSKEDNALESYFTAIKPPRLIWQSMKRLKLREKHTFLWAVMDIQNATIICHYNIIYEYEGLNIDRLLDKFHEIAFYYGYLTIVEHQNWKYLKFTNEWMRMCFENELMKELRLDEGPNMLNLLSTDNIKAFFSAASQKMANLAAFMGQKSDLEHEDYVHALFAFVVRMLFAYHDRLPDKILEEAFFCLNEEPLFECKERPDSIISFTTKDKNNKHCKKNLIIQFKCKQPRTEISIRETEMYLLEKCKKLSSDPKNAEKLKGGRYIYVGGVLMSGQIEDLRYYKCSDSGDQLVEDQEVH